MRAFDEETGGETSKETVVILTKDEGKLVIEALELLAAANKRKKTVTKLLKEFNSKLNCY
jgi:hypothetical protein